jgi:hypothetical protein
MSNPVDLEKMQEAYARACQRPLTYGQLRQQIEAEHPGDPRHYGAAKIARVEAEWKASHPWVRWAAVISDAICASSSVPLHYKHAVRDAMDALPIAVQASDERQS